MWAVRNLFRRFRVAIATTLQIESLILREFLVKLEFQSALVILDRVTDADCCLPPSRVPVARQRIHLLVRGMDVLANDLAQPGDFRLDDLHNLHLVDFANGSANQLHGFLIRKPTTPSAKRCSSSSCLPLLSPAALP